MPTAANNNSERADSQSASLRSWAESDSRSLDQWLPDERGDNREVKKSPRRSDQLGKALMLLPAPSASMLRDVADSVQIALQLPAKSVLPRIKTAKHKRREANMVEHKKIVTYVHMSADDTDYFRIIYKSWLPRESVTATSAYAYNRMTSEFTLEAVTVWDTAATSDQAPPLFRWPAGEDMRYFFPEVSHKVDAVQFAHLFSNAFLSKMDIPLDTGKPEVQEQSSELRTKKAQSSTKTDPPLPLCPKPNQVINPATGRCIDKNRLEMRLLAEKQQHQQQRQQEKQQKQEPRAHGAQRARPCPKANQVINPATGRCIDKKRLEMRLLAEAEQQQRQQKQQKQELPAQRTQRARKVPAAALPASKPPCPKPNQVINPTTGRCIDKKRLEMRMLAKEEQQQRQQEQQKQEPRAQRTQRARKAPAAALPTSKPPCPKPNQVINPATGRCIDKKRLEMRRGAH